MKQKLLYSLSSLILSCTPFTTQPLPPPTQQEQQAIALTHIDQHFSTTCQTYTVNDKEIHCTLPKEPYYFHYRWDEIRTTYCHGNRLIFETILDTKTTNTTNYDSCTTLSSELNTYLRLANRK